MTTQVDESIYDDAMNAEAPTGSRMAFGSIEVDLWKCILVKGTGKVLFDTTAHGADQKRTAIDLSLIPLQTARNHEAIKRNLIAESKEWTQIMRPSLTALGTDLRGINGRFVQVEYVP